jgi:PAS domain S-box-containing protein
MSLDSTDGLRAENAELRHQLAEALDTIRAIQGGEVDAVVVTGHEQPTVFTLETADKPYRLLVEQMRQGAATLTIDGIILYCNHRFAELLRQPHESLLGRPIRGFVDEANMPLFDALLQDGLAAGVEGEVMLRRGDGKLVPVFLGVSALREGVAGVCLIVADLTEQKRRERLVADEAMARSILEQVADAVVVCDSAGIVVRASRAAHALCGSNPILKPFGEVFPLIRFGPEWPNGERVDVGAAWRGETLHGWSVCLPRSTGDWFELLLSAGPLLAAGGDVLGAVVTLTDITALRRAEDELRRQAAELREADQRKDEFLAMLAHELRNPLAPIRASLEIMNLKGLDDPQVRKSRDVIARQVLQLTRLVDDLLEVSRISSGKIALKPEPVDLAIAVTQAVEISRPVLNAKGHHLTVNLPAPPIRLMADPTRLVQVLGNILNNAAKYTEEGGQITVAASQEGAEVVIRVRDTGLGIPPDMLAKVFDLFTQVDRSLDRAQGGLGIGLALVKRLVAMHGGRVEVSSAGPGKGSEFVVRLPVNLNADEQKTGPAPTARKAGAASRRVLVVDDNTDAADSLSILLSLLGHEVRIAGDGPTALAVAAEFHPDIVLCDIGLPLMDGYEVLRRLRTEPGFAATRFVAITGYGQDEDLRKSKTAGFHAHLVKPLDLNKLEAVLSQGV